MSDPKDTKDIMGITKDYESLRDSPFDNNKSVYSILKSAVKAGFWNEKLDALSMMVAKLENKYLSKEDCYALTDLSERISNDAHIKKMSSYEHINEKLNRFNGMISYITEKRLDKYKGMEKLEQRKQEIESVLGTENETKELNQELFVLYDQLRNDYGDKSITSVMLRAQMQRAAEYGTSYKRKLDFDFDQTKTEIKPDSLDDFIEYDDSADYIDTSADLTYDGNEQVYSQDGDQDITITKKDSAVGAGKIANIKPTKPKRRFLGRWGSAAAASLLISAVAVSSFAQEVKQIYHDNVVPIVRSIVNPNGNNTANYTRYASASSGSENDLFPDNGDFDTPTDGSQNQIDVPTSGTPPTFTFDDSIFDDDNGNDNPYDDGGVAPGIPNDPADDDIDTEIGHDAPTNPPANPAEDPNAKLKAMPPVDIMKYRIPDTDAKLYSSKNANVTVFIERHETYYPGEGTDKGIRSVVQGDLVVPITGDKRTSVNLNGRVASDGTDEYSGQIVHNFATNAYIGVGGGAVNSEPTTMVSAGAGFKANGDNHRIAVSNNSISGTTLTLDNVISYNFKYKSFGLYGVFLRDGNVTLNPEATIFYSLYTGYKQGKAQKKMDRNIDQYNNVERVLMTYFLVDDIKNHFRTGAQLAVPYRSSKGKSAAAENVVKLTKQLDACTMSIENYVNCKDVLDFRGKRFTNKKGEFDPRSIGEAIVFVYLEKDKYFVKEKLSPATLKLIEDITNRKDVLNAIPFKEGFSYYDVITAIKDANADVLTYSTDIKQIVDQYFVKDKKGIFVFQPTKGLDASIAGSERASVMQKLDKILTNIMVSNHANASDKVLNLADVVQVDFLPDLLMALTQDQTFRDAYTIILQDLDRMQQEQKK